MADKCCEEKEQRDCCHQEVQDAAHHDSAIGETTCACHHHHKEKECGDTHKHESCHGHKRKSCCEHEHESCCEHEHHEHHEHRGAGCACCGEEEKKESKAFAILKWVFIAVSLGSLILSYLDMHKLTGLEFFHYVDIGWIAVILCGYDIFRSAVKSLSHKKITASVLISIAIIASIGLEIVRLVNPSMAGGGHDHSYIFAAGEVAFLMQIGELIEYFTVAKSRSGIEKMMNLSPSTAEVMLNGELIIKSLEEIQIGDIVLCRAGNRISVDGEVIAGISAVDESALTGESIPVDKMIGSKVYGGTMNLNGMLQVRVTETREDMIVNKLVNLMLEAEGNRAPIARLADKWASYIVPSAIGLAFMIGIICSFIPSIGWAEALVRAVTVLVVFCPCSLALATPTAIAAGIGKCASNGIMVKNGAAIEVLAGVKNICFDKTGTLTNGELGIQNVISDKLSREELLSLAGSAEEFSEHPIARAITASATNIVKATEVTAKVGSGVVAMVNGEKIEVISLKDSLHIIGEYKSVAQKEAETGATVVCVFRNGEIVGIISLADTIKEGAKTTINALKEMDITPVMLTGDGELTAKKIASECGIDNYAYSLLPQDKTAKIESLMESGKTCMVGDGINDAPALATADAGISIAGIGSDIAVASSDMALMDGKITKLPFLVKLSKRVLRTIKFNIIGAMTVNVVAVILSALGILTPALGALVHNCTSILVVAHSASILANKSK